MALVVNTRVDSANCSLITDHFDHMTTRHLPSEKCVQLRGIVYLDILYRLLAAPPAAPMMDPVSALRPSDRRAAALA